jgi:hypothetical protein
MADKINLVKRYYKGREMDEGESTVRVELKGDKVVIQDYDDDIEIDKPKLRILIYGSFITNCYDVEFVNISEDIQNPDPIGIPLAVGISGYDKARQYAKAGAKALNAKYLEDFLLVGPSNIDRDYIVLMPIMSQLRSENKLRYEFLK